MVKRSEAENRTVPVLAGVTASGKTAAALALAENRAVEIVSADAMMVYRGLDIGTAKPSQAERTRVPHHFIDIKMPDENFSVAAYVHAAETAIEAILAKGKLPFIVGGTGFYIRALTEGLPSAPQADPAQQAHLWQRVEQEGIEPLIRDLVALSPEDARRAQRNPRRVVRALELFERTGKGPSAFPLLPSRFKFDKLALVPGIATLTPRIRARTETMFARGLVAEVEALRVRYPDLGTARQAIGYKEVWAYLEGETSLAETNAAVTRATLKYAKRQRTWFRKEPDARLFETAAGDIMGTLERWVDAHIV